MRERLRFSHLGLFACVMTSVLAHGATAIAQVSEQAVSEVRAMHWEPASGTKLPTSQSEITKLPGYVVVLGEEARRARQLEDGSKSVDADVEADAVNPRTGSEAIFSYTPTGYIASTDWNKIDPDRFLDEVRRNTETANVSRRAIGSPELHVLGWLQRPKLNPDTHTASWIIRASSSDGRQILNAISLKLGRAGYERIVLVEDASQNDVAQSARASQDLLYVTNSHNFSPGKRYIDYVPGKDRAAEYGVAGLVAGVLGVKLLHVAAAGGILLLFKKAAWILLLPFLWLWKALRSKLKHPG